MSGYTVSLLWPGAVAGWSLRPPWKGACHWAGQEGLGGDGGGTASVVGQQRGCRGKQARPPILPFILQTFHRWSASTFPCWKVTCPRCGLCRVQRPGVCGWVLSYGCDFSSQRWGEAVAGGGTSAGTSSRDGAWRRRLSSDVHVFAEAALLAPVELGVSTRTCSS